MYLPKNLRLSSNLTPIRIIWVKTTIKLIAHKKRLAEGPTVWRARDEADAFWFPCVLCVQRLSDSWSVVTYTKYTAHRTRSGRKIYFGYQQQIESQVNRHGVGFQNVRSNVFPDKYWGGGNSTCISVIYQITLPHMKGKCRKGPSIYDVCNILGFFDPLSLPRISGFCSFCLLFGDPPIPPPTADVISKPPNSKTVLSYWDCLIQ